MEVKENKMGVMPVNKLLINMSVPIMISMLIQALYNVVDSIFVARVNENALAAVSLAFPVQNLMIAIAVGTGVGINALLSRSLGSKKYKEANSIARNGLFLAFISYSIFLVFGLFFAKTYFSTQTDIPQIVDYGTSYLTIISIFSIGLFSQITLERLLQSTGKTIYTMISQGTGAIINIILDPLFIFGLFGFPKMGVAGAAVATVIGQISAAFIGLYFNLKYNKEISFNFKKFKPQLRIIKKIYSVGIPSIMMVSLTSITTYGINNILIKFSSTATAVFGVYYKLQSFVFMPVFGLNNGMVPIIAYNYGAEHKERLVKTIKLSILYAIGIMAIGLTVMQIFPSQLLSLFKASPEMISIGVPALRIISLGYLFAGFNIVASSIYQSFGNGVISLVAEASRQLLVLLPAVYFLSKLGEVNLIWWGYPIAESLALFLNIIFIRLIFKKIINPMPENNTI